MASSYRGIREMVSEKWMPELKSVDRLGVKSGWGQRVEKRGKFSR